VWLGRDGCGKLVQVTMYELRAEHYYYLATSLLCTMHCSVLVLQYLCGSPV